MLSFIRKRLVIALVLFCCAVFTLAKFGPTGQAGIVDGDWIADPNYSAPITLGNNVSVTLPMVNSTPGLISVPITVSDLTAFAVISYDLNIDFNSAVVTPASPAFTQTGTLSSTMSITPNAANAGHLIISAFQGASLTGSGTLLFLNFNVIGVPGQTTPLAFMDYTDPGMNFHPGFVFNEGDPMASPITNGSVSIVGDATSTATFTPTNSATATNTATLTPTATNTPTNIPTNTPTNTPTNAPTATVTPTGPQYQIFDIGVVVPTDTASQGFGVSVGGVAVGRSVRTGGAQAFTYIGGAGIAGLPNLAGRSFAVANAAIDSGAGTVVGTAANTLFGTARLPVIWHGGVVSQLPLPAGETLGDAFDINSSMIAVGSAGGGSLQRGVIYNGATGTVISQTTSNGSFFTTAFGINDAGRIAGIGIDPNNAARNVPMVYDIGAGSAIDIGALPGFNSAIAFGIGNGGHVVGASMLNQGSGLPFIWTQANGMVAIPLPIGTTQGSARGVNSTGWAVGTASSAFAIPFLYNGIATYRVQDLIPAGTGWDLSMNTSSSAMGISDGNIIVGTGVFNGAIHAYYLVPAGTATPTNTATNTPTNTATLGPTPTVTATVSATATATPVSGGLTVDRTDDNGAANACTAAPNDCTLRGAIGNANTAASDDVVDFDAGVFGSPQTITLGGSEIVIAGNGSLTINGPGANLLTVSGNNASRIISTGIGVVATINDARFTAGNGIGAASMGRGGAIYNASGNLSLNRVIITGNSAANGGGTNNAAATGGGGATMTLNDSIVSNNTVTSSGGGMQNFSTSTLNISNSSITGNTAALGAGGIQANGTFKITNSTIANNTANGGSGGGVVANGTAAPAFVNTTIAGNSASGDGGGISRAGTPAVLGNCIIATNLDVGDNSNPDVAGPFLSQGNNLIGIAGNATGFPGPNDQIGTAASPINPMLAPLTNNGGFTDTMSLMPASTAINAGNNALALDNNGQPLINDQRGLGFPRIVGGTVDIGAFEVQGGATATPTNTPTFTPTNTATATPTPGITNPLFAGVDDPAIPAALINVTNSSSVSAFSGFQVWGAAFDPINNKVYFNSGSTLLEWPVGGTVTTLGPITDTGGALQAMVGLAFYNGNLYGTKNIANEAIYLINPSTRIATVHIDYVDADVDCGGFEADPNTGNFYCTNDDATPYGASLVRINGDASVTVIAPYPVGQTDIDGLAISPDGKAYLVTDDANGPIFVYDFVSGTYGPQLTAPWPTSEVFSGATWIGAAGGTPTPTATASPSATSTATATNTATNTPSGVPTTPATSTATATPTTTATFTPTATPPLIQFSSATYGEDESQVATITVTRSGSVGLGSDVLFSTTNGTATGGAACTVGVDYVSMFQVVAFSQGETSKTVNITICGDNITEPDQTVNLSLGNPVGGTLGSPSTAVLTINDTATVFRNSAPIALNLGAGPANPYPSSITVMGGPPVIGSMRVTLYDYTAAIPNLTNFLLVGPGSQHIVLMANAGGSESTPGSGLTLNFTDTAGQVVPNSGSLAAGDFEPTSYGGLLANFPAPAPTPPYNLPGNTVGGSGTQTFLGNFGGTNSNGQWSLYIISTLPPFPTGGCVCGGWGIEFLSSTAAQASISGRVMTANGQGIRNATVVMTGNSLAEPRVATTGTFGYYTFDGLEVGQTYVVTINSRRYTFSTPSRVISLVDNVADADFVADP